MLRVTSGVGGGSVPFTFGQVFREGDVPSGMGVRSNLPQFQAVVRTRWPDGSAKAAVLSGRAMLTAGRTGELRLSKAAGEEGGAPIGLGALQALNPQASVSLSGYGTVTLGSVLGSPLKQTIAGPQMSEWVYRQPVGSDAHLVVWWRVRYYGGTDLDILVGVENGYLTVANPAQKNYTATITINGTQRYSGTLTHYHHTRWARQFWYVTDPQVVPGHDGRYLTDTKLFPNYGWRNPSAAALDAMSSSLEPFAQNDFPAAIGTAGYDPSIGLLPIWDALYVTSGDARAWRSMIAHAFSYGRYGVHFRDERTQQAPRLADYPNLVIDATTGIGATGASTTNQYTPGAAQGPVPAFRASHHPAPPYAAALLSGEWWFVEEVQMVASTNTLHGSSSASDRDFARGLLKTGNAGAARSAGWRLRTLAMAATVSADDDPLRAEYRRMWAENMKWYADRYVRGTIDGGAYVNNLGLFEAYSANRTSAYNPGGGKWWEGSWMQAFVQASIGFAWDMKPGAEGDHRLVRDFGYKLTAGLMGDANGWDYRRGAPYEFPVSQTESQTPPSYFPSFKAMLDYYEQFKGLGSIAAINDTLLRTESTNNPTTPSQMSTGYWANHQPARAWAVDHGAAGAATGYARITSAANYGSLLSQLHDVPVWGIVPRR